MDIRDMNLGELAIYVTKELGREMTDAELEKLIDAYNELVGGENDQTL